MMINLVIGESSQTCADITLTANTLSTISIPFYDLVGVGNMATHSLLLSDVVSGGDDSICPTTCTLLSDDNLYHPTYWADEGSSVVNPDPQDDDMTYKLAYFAYEDLDTTGKIDTWEEWTAITPSSAITCDASLFPDLSLLSDLTRTPKCFYDRDLSGRGPIYMQYRQNAPFDIAVEMSTTHYSSEFQFMCEKGDASSGSYQSVWTNVFTIQSPCDAVSAEEYIVDSFA
jgi:hypothetical protein